MSGKILKSISLRLATADEIRRLSNGEVRADGTFDDAGAPVPGGLFCPTIFGRDGRRFGHIELGYPVVHPWYEDVVQLLIGINDISDGKAVMEALRSVDLTNAGDDPRICAIRKSGISVEALVLQAVPVVPTSVRPLAQVAGATLSSDLNELYRRVISRNNALGELLNKSSEKLPGAYVRDARDGLTAAVRALIGGSGEPCALQSLTDLLTDENGFLKRNLEGKRADYSGRTVIVSGPELNVDQCGLPRDMALEMMRPFVARKLLENGVVASASQALELSVMEPDSKDVRRALEQVAAEHTILLNRAPTLHRLGIQPFHPVLVDHHSISLHPLMCCAFNADFDGDQMAAHVPLSQCARQECEELLDSAVNLVSPANGTPITGPVQDIVLGLWFLTASPSHEGEDKSEGMASDIISALQSGELHPHSPVTLKDETFSGHESIETAAGRVLFNASLPPDLRFVNVQTDRRRLQEIVAECLAKCGRSRTRQMLDDLNRLGFDYATRYAPSYGLGVIPPSDLVEPMRVQVLAKEADLRKQLASNKIDAEVFASGVADLWSEASDAAREGVRSWFEAQENGLNPIRAMISSGSRGGDHLYGSSFGILGRMWKAAAYTEDRACFEAGVASSFWDGLSPLEHFGRTFGARTGMIDTHIRQYEAILLMKNLIFAAQGILVTAEDCGTSDGIEISRIEFEGRVLQRLADRIRGRVAAADVKPASGKVLIKAGELISKEQAETAEAAGIESVLIRSSLICTLEKGVCAKCYGEDLSYGNMVKPGAAVGVLAAQSVSEPAVQLTYRTFYPACPVPMPGTTHHPGGLQQMIELFDGGRPELSPMELIEAVQRILRFQSIDVSDKHFELLARRMYSFTRIEEPGDTCFAVGQIVDNEVLTTENAHVSVPATGVPAMLGAKAAAANSSSVIGSAAVGDPKHILSVAALAGARDTLDGALERIVAGLAPNVRTL